MNIFKAIKRAFLTVFGDIKIFRYPFFIIYNPTTFKVKGIHTRAAMNVLKPGDIVLRKYVNYLDGYFIPGEYSHSSLYVGRGKIIHAVADGVEYIDVIDFLRCDSFCILRQADEDLAKKAVEFAEKAVENGAEYDFDFKSGNDSYYCHELVATAYKDLGIEKKSIKMFGFFKISPRYISESFLENEKFTKILEKKL
jgi:uncharacterized protein YycO